MAGDKQWTVPGNANTDFGFEVWPQIMEKAFAKFVGYETYFQTGMFPSDVMQALTGKEFVNIDLRLLADAEAIAKVRDAASLNLQATISTHRLDPKLSNHWVLPDGKMLWRLHAYMIDSLSADQTKVVLRGLVWVLFIVLGGCRSES